MDPENSPATPGGLFQSSPSPLPPQSLAQVTPSDTTVTLPTPDPAHAQLVSIQRPPRFIFYPISWDGSEDFPTQGQKIVPPNLASLDMYAKCVDSDQLNSPSAVFCSTDAFWSIDQWRRDVVKCGGGTADLLDPIQDADTPLPLLSFPHDHHGNLRGTPPVGPPLRGTRNNGSENDSVQL